MTTKSREGEQAFDRERHYIDPMGTKVPELERCLVRHRSLQMILIVYYAEELKRDVINHVAFQMRKKGIPTLNTAEGSEPSEEGKKQRHAFTFLVQEGILTPAERKHMVSLIGRRNAIAHHLEQVTADLTTDRWAREWIDMFPKRQEHDYEAVQALRAARRLLSERMNAYSRISEFDMRGFLFASTERVLLADIKALEKRILALVRRRKLDIAALNAELSLEGTELTGTFDPAWPDNRYGERGPLTPRGVETCYILFDMGKSPLSVAHLMEISLPAARKRARQWSTLGGQNRTKRPLSEIPKVRRRYKGWD
jgi:hypothetical protein